MSLFLTILFTILFRKMVISLFQRSVLPFLENHFHFLKKCSRSFFTKILLLLGLFFLTTTIIKPLFVVPLVSLCQPSTSSFPNVLEIFNSTPNVPPSFFETHKKLIYYTAGGTLGLAALYGLKKWGIFEMTTIVKYYTPSVVCYNVRNIDKGPYEVVLAEKSTNFKVSLTSLKDLQVTQ